MKKFQGMVMVFGFWGTIIGISILGLYWQHSLLSQQKTLQLLQNAFQKAAYQQRIMQNVSSYFASPDPEKPEPSVESMVTKVAQDNGLTNVQGNSTAVTSPKEGHQSLYRVDAEYRFVVQRDEWFWSFIQALDAQFSGGILVTEMSLEKDSGGPGDPFLRGYFKAQLMRISAVPAKILDSAPLEESR